MEGDERLNYLLNLVIETFINRGEPVGSKFLYALENNDYAPSTLRKYLNMLEKEGMLYQPYHSAGRIPTIKAFSEYVENIIEEKTYEEEQIDFDLDYARNSLRYIVEKLGNLVDGVVVGFLKNDEYYFLGINNLFRNTSAADYDVIVHLVEFIEEKKIVNLLNSKMVKNNNIYYEFIQDDDKVISTMYVKVNVNGYDGIISILGPIRMNYKKNLGVLNRFLSQYKD